MTTIADVAAVAKDLFGIERTALRRPMPNGRGTSSNWDANAAKAGAELGWGPRSLSEMAGDVRRLGASVRGRRA